MHRQVRARRREKARKEGGSVTETAHVTAFLKKCSRAHCAMQNPAHSALGSVCKHTGMHACLQPFTLIQAVLRSSPFNPPSPGVTSISHILLMHTLKSQQSLQHPSELLWRLAFCALQSLALRDFGVCLPRQAGWLFVYIWVVTESLLLQLLQTELYLNHSF